MKVALCLHCYQPPTQYANVLKTITYNSYERLLNCLDENREVKITFNFSASLTEQLSENGFDKLLDRIANLSKKGRIELLGSAAYHPLLTEIPEREVRRQIELNNEINRQYFGEIYKPKAFFAPEMAVDENVVKIIADEGFKSILVDESVSDKKLTDGVFRLDSLNCLLVPRNKNLSLKVAFAGITRASDLVNSGGDLPHIILAMDGETFGHHQPQQLNLLNELCRSEKIEMVTLSDIIESLPVYTLDHINKSTWGFWERWINPKNPIHKLQWELTHLAIQTVYEAEKKNHQTKKEVGVLNLKGEADISLARQLLDRSLHSDQFWWASANPFWHYQMVIKGAEMLNKVVITVPNANDQDKRKANDLYQSIMENAKALRGEGIIEPQLADIDQVSRKADAGTPPTEPH